MSSGATTNALEIRRWLRSIELSLIGRGEDSAMAAGIGMWKALVNSETMSQVCIRRGVPSSAL